MVRIYYHRLKVLIQPKKKKRRLIAIDETKLKLEEKLIFVWAAIDYEGMLYGPLKEEVPFTLTFLRSSKVL